MSTFRILAVSTLIISSLTARAARPATPHRGETPQTMTVTLLDSTPRHTWRTLDKALESYDLLLKREESLTAEIDCGDEDDNVVFVEAVEMPMRQGERRKTEIRATSTCLESSDVSLLVLQNDLLDAAEAIRFD